jgi:hypothetical protein
MDMKLSLPPFTPPVSLYHCSDVIPIHHHITLSLNERCESGERWKWRPDIQAVGKRLGERESMSMSERQWSKRDGGRKEMVDRVRESQRENMSYFCRIFGVHISYLL